VSTGAKDLSLVARTQLENKLGEFAQQVKWGNNKNKNVSLLKRLKSTATTTTKGNGQAAKASSEASSSSSKGSNSTIFDGMDLSKAAGEAASTAAETEVTKSGGYLGLAALSVFTGIGLSGYIFTSEDVKKVIDNYEKSIPESVALAGRSYADWREGMEENVKQFSDPSSEKLLPELPPQAAQFMRTLVLDLDETLVHSEWRRERGWRTFKRPGVDEFLRHISQFYEVVVYTGQLSTYGDPIMERLDPNRYVPYRLYRDATLYEDGKHYRDLKRLNRDLGRVLYISSDIKNCTCPENAIEIKPWKLESDDTTLLDLMPFLEMIIRSQLPDVRKVVESYQGKDVPSEFRKRSTEIKKNVRQKSTNQPRLFSGGPRS
jgi:import inner membrane translocase subunit TIM50